MSSFFGLMMIFIGLVELPSDLEHGVVKIIFGTLFIGAAVTLGILYLKTAKSMNQQRNYKFVHTMSIICCFGSLLSVVLGVMTLGEAAYQRSVSSKWGNDTVILI